jgi:hypothetical protein
VDKIKTSFEKTIINYLLLVVRVLPPGIASKYLVYLLIHIAHFTIFITRTAKMAGFTRG